MVIKERSILVRAFTQKKKKNSIHIFFKNPWKKAKQKGT
jgi:tRNA G46 methylase TrmB